MVEPPGSKWREIFFYAVPPGSSYQHLLFDLPRLVLSFAPGFYCDSMLKHLLFSVLLLYLFSLG